MGAGMLIALAVMTLSMMTVGVTVIVSLARGVSFDLAIRIIAPALAVEFLSGALAVMLA